MFRDKVPITLNNISYVTMTIKKMHLKQDNNYYLYNQIYQKKLLIVNSVSNINITQKLQYSCCMVVPLVIQYIPALLCGVELAICSHDVAA